MKSDATKWDKMFSHYPEIFGDLPTRPSLWVFSLFYFWSVAFLTRFRLLSEGATRRSTSGSPRCFPTLYVFLFSTNLCVAFWNNGEDKGCINKWPRARRCGMQWQQKVHLKETIIMEWTARRSIIHRRDISLIHEILPLFQRHSLAQYQKYMKASLSISLFHHVILWSGIVELIWLT